MYMKNNKSVIVNIYNFIRMSHVEPSVFIPDDFETVRNQMTLVRQYGFPATYALKYDALMEPRYQELLKMYSGERDEISAWWEITGQLCEKAGVAFRGTWAEDYDDRVDSAYSIGYAPEERRMLVDAYMADFYQVFGFYPKTIGSWVLDTVTLSYAAEKYGILGAAICRDQMGTDGFTLWGGFPNGIYYPSKSNENIPAADKEHQLTIPMFRLLGPDPIYNFEQDVRDGLQGVYTLEPSWLTGRNPEWISWYFRSLTQEDSLGVGYAHVGQENNFLWENIRPGMEPQLKELKQLLEKGVLRVETMADSAEWFRNTYRLTPPMSFQASEDWDKTKNLSAQWYACGSYRLGFLGEGGRLRIRDCFLYRHDYPSRYLNGPMKGTKSLFDALPLLFPQRWTDRLGQRPFLRLISQEGAEPTGAIRYGAVDGLTSQAQLLDRETGHPLATFTMRPDHILLEGPYSLCFDYLPNLTACRGRQVLLEHEGFSYGFEVTEGRILSRLPLPGNDSLGNASEEEATEHICRDVSEERPKEHTYRDVSEEETTAYRLVIRPENGRIRLKMGESVTAADIFHTSQENAEQKPTSQDFAAQKPASQDLAAQKPTSQDPAEQKPASHQNPAERKPTSQDPATDNGAQGKPSVLTGTDIAASRRSADKAPRQYTAQKPFLVPPMAPEADPVSCIFPIGTIGQIKLSSGESGEIRFTLDGSEPTKTSPLYTGPLTLKEDTLLSAKLFLPDGCCSDTARWRYRFGLTGICLTSGTAFDPRPIFHGNGISDLLNPKRGSLDYLDGRWRGTLQDLEVCGQLPAPAAVKEIAMGFLSHHRSGIVFPESLRLYTGPDPEHLSLTAERKLPCGPCPREIYTQDFSLPVHMTIGAFRLTAHRYEKMPLWCCYRGSTDVFTMADNIIVVLQS